MKTVTSGGVRIAYEEAGKGDPAVVLIHPPLGFRSQLGPVFEHLARSHRVLAPDLRGTGASDVPASGYTIGDFAADVVAVCRDAAVDRVVLCGHSLGAAIALDVASIQPDMVAGIVMLDGAVLYPDAVRNQVLTGLVPALEGDGWLEALRGFFAGRMFVPVDPPELRAQVLASLAALPRQLPAAVMRDGFARDFAPQIAARQHPLMFVRATVPADLDRLKQLRPDAVVASVAGSGHFMAQVVPEQVNAMLDRFLAILPEMAGV